jgi:hypothetical protein
MLAIRMTCPYSDGVKCFFTPAQCVDPNIWNTPIPRVPEFPPTLGFCLSPVAGGYINLSIANWENITNTAILAFIDLKESTASAAVRPLSLTTIIGISVGAFALLIIIIWSFTACKKRTILIHTPTPSWQAV